VEMPKIKQASRHHKKTKRGMVIPNNVSPCSIIM
jgi:hypothetical protein